MADYYPLISRAVDALSERTPAMRRAVYDRAHEALIGQLRSLDPPLSEADITRERLSLDDAVNRVELDQVDRDIREAAGAMTFAGGPGPAPEASAVPEVPPEPPPAAEERPPRPEPVAAARPNPSRAGGPAAPVERFDEAFPPERTIDDGSAEAAVPGGGAQRERPRVDTRGIGAPRQGRGRSLVLGLALALVIGGIAVAAWLLRDEPSELPNQPVTAEAPVSPPAPSDSKLADRVGGGSGGDRPAVAGPPSAPPTATNPGPSAAGAPAASAPPAAPSPRTGAAGEIAVAQRAILYEENPAEPQSPRVTAGRAIWRLDAVNAGQGQPLETVVRGTVEVPQAQLTLNLVLRRNLDQTLPASHTIELTFATAPGEPNRVVRDVGLLQLKNEEIGRGTPTAGLPVPVRDNLFLIGLSNLPGDVERNTELLTKRNWIDLPIRFAGGQRAIVSFEKGVSGEQVLSEAFRQWQ